MRNDFEIMHKTEARQPWPNLPLLADTLRQIITDPDSWHQETWRCGTRACFAGHAALIDGATWYYPKFASSDRVMVPEHAHPYVKADSANVGPYAVWALGLNEQEGNALFQGSNEIHDIVRRIGDVIQRAYDTHDRAIEINHRHDAGDHTGCCQLPDPALTDNDPF